MTAWPGHSASTRVRLLAILERAMAGERKFTLAERILFTACEFRASTMAGELHSHTGRQSLERLQLAAQAYTTLGAVRGAAEINEAIRDLGGPLTLVQQRRRLKLLEARLQQQSEPVDRHITAFAAQMGQGASRPARQVAA